MGARQFPRGAKAQSAAGDAFIEAGRLLVDPFSEISWLPAFVLRRAGIAVRKSEQRFQLAGGRTITRHIGYAVIRVDDFETVDEVVFAVDGDPAVLGMRALEGFNVLVDPNRSRLIAAGPIPAVRKLKS